MIWIIIGGVVLYVVGAMLAGLSISQDRLLKDVDAFAVMLWPLYIVCMAFYIPWLLIRGAVNAINIHTQNNFGGRE